ncbi:MAG TPA: PilZ domain-containing protein [Vicinamibacterales bacterium]|nr:PilZ domain-containing protein [Vicinamibacterales bacterium]
MTPDKRKYPRFAKPLEARWQGASGGTQCFVGDISWGGCFVQTVAMPAVGESTLIDVMIAGREARLSGSVVYTMASIGFAIQFDPLTDEQKDVLKELLGVPPGTT